jgi:DNA-binding transcriptional MerR regulator
VVRDGGGRRVYNELHVGWLELVDRLRGTGMSVAEMREYARLVQQGRATLQQRQDMLARHRQRVLDTIAEWKLALKLIDSKIGFYGEWISTGHRPAEIPSGASLRPSRRQRTRKERAP